MSKRTYTGFVIQNIADSSFWGISGDPTTDLRNAKVYNFKSTAEAKIRTVGRRAMQIGMLPVRIVEVTGSVVYELPPAPLATVIEVH